MKLMRVGPKGHEKPAVLDAQGKVRDLSGLMCDITPHQLTPEGQAALRAIDLAKLPVIDNPGRIAPPWSGVGKFVAIGLNYSDHAAESNLPVPKEPVVFTKATSCIQGPDDAVMLPKGSVKSDWEVEQIKQAFAIADHCYDAMKAKVAKGVSEIEVAAAGEYAARSRGASGFGFSAIVGSGARSNAAATLAAGSGFTNAYNILEGFEGDKDAGGHRNKVGGWRHANLPWTQG